MKDKNLFLKGFVKKNYYSGLYELIEIQINWQFIIQDIHIENNCFPYKILNKSGNVAGSLFLDVKSNFMLEAQLKKEYIIKMINRYFNKILLKDIVTIPMVD